MIIDVRITQPASSGITSVIDHCIGHVNTFPSRQLRAKVEVGIFVVKKKIVLEEIKQFRKMMFENISGGKDVFSNIPIPLVGAYDNYSGIRGVGPVENQGILNI